MIQINVEKILKEQGKTKSWLCDEMDISFYNLNKAIKSGKKSISYKYLEGFCKALNCSFNDLLTIVVNDNIRIGGKYWFKYYNVSCNVQIKIIKIKFLD